jgi:hypothetical protein
VCLALALPRRSGRAEWDPDLDFGSAGVWVGLWMDSELL